MVGRNKPKKKDCCNDTWADVNWSKTGKNWDIIGHQRKFAKIPIDESLLILYNRNFTERGLWPDLMLENAMWWLFFKEGYNPKFRNFFIKNIK